MNVPSVMYLRKKVLLSTFATFLFLVFLSQESFSQSYVIIGSFSSYAKASESLSTYRSTYGRNPGVLTPDASSNKYRVYIFQSPTRNAATAFKNSLKDKGLPYGWVHTQQGRSSADIAMVSRSAGYRMAEESYAKNGYETYYLIAASFDSFEKAEQEKLKKESEGFEAQVLFPDAGKSNYKVSVFFSTNKKQIQRYQTLLSRRGTKSWIYTARPGTQVIATDIANRNTAPIPSPAPVIATTNVSRGAAAPAQSFHVIGGSFKSLEQANNAREAMLMKGVNALVKPPLKAGGYFRLSVYQAKSREEAKVVNADLKKRGLLSNGWILPE